jgi:pimeloyl-ACP methyl ester carboxylesterase
MRTVALLASFLLFASSPTLAQTPDTSKHTEQYFERNGVRLHYLDWGGAGEPLVFLTGYGAAPHVFDGLAERFRSRFRMVSPTRRGRTPSDSPATGYTLQDFTGDVVALMDHVKMPKAHLVVHSIAGAEATQLAIDHPDRVLSIVYLDAALDAAKGEAMLSEMPIPNPRPAPGTPFFQVRQWWTKYTPDFARLRVPSLAFFALPVAPPLPAKVPEDLRVKVETFWRDRWLPTTRAMIERFRETAPNSRLVVMEGASHYLFRDREDDVVGEMTAFYDGLKKPAVGRD